MFTDIALIVLLGLIAGEIFKRINMPYIIGMLMVGMIIGPFALDLIDKDVLEFSPELRKIALMVVLLKAGLLLDIEDLKKVGRPAILMCFVPATFEILGIIIFGPKLLGISILEAAIIGSVLGAASPAIIVPRMVKMINEGYGKKKSIPQMLIAGASAGDVYVVIIFMALLGMAKDKEVSIEGFLSIPIAIILGLALGVISGYILVKIFTKFSLRDTLKILILLAISFLFEALEEKLNGIVKFSGLLAIMSMGIMINFIYPEMAKRVSGKFAKIWIGTEVMLFVFVGASVNLSHVFQAGFFAIIVLFIGLLFRFLGTYLSVVKAGFNKKEKLFCAFSQVPKATVQAAIGGVPLSMGLACGDLTLSIAVISIIITAPLGGILIDKTYKKLLRK